MEAMNNTRLAEFLDGRGVSQREAAEALVISPASVSKHWLGGNFNFSIGIKYHEVLGVPMEILKAHPEFIGKATPPKKRGKAKATPSPKAGAPTDAGFV